MNILNSCCRGLTFQYLEEKQGYAIYGMAIDTLLGGDNQRCWLAFVPAHLAIQKTARLSELPWRNLQARTCPKETYKLRPQAWVIPRNLPNLNLYLKTRTNNYTTYECRDTAGNSPGEFPFEVLLIHSPKKTTIYQYPNSINLYWAIDQFNTVFNYIGTPHPMHETDLRELPSLPTIVDNTPKPPGLVNPLQTWFEGTSVDDSNVELI